MGSKLLPSHIRCLPNENTSSHERPNALCVRAGSEFHYRQPECTKPQFSGSLASRCLILWLKLLSIGEAMNSSAAINIVSPTQFDRGTAQTPGSERRAAIAPALGIASAIWGGLFEVEPGSRTGIHHHGEQETIAYVLSGVCEIRWGEKGESVGRATAGDFIHVPAFLPHMEINPSDRKSVV